MTSPAAQALLDGWAVRGSDLGVPGAATRVWSQGTGDPVLCLHGVPTSAYGYRKLLGELAARGLRGVALDLPGCGLAERPGPGFDFSWTALSGWVLSAADELGLDRFHLLVHDIGGPIGFDLVRRAPDRIRSLTVLNTLVHVDGFTKPWPMRPFAVPGLGELWLRATPAPAFAALMRATGVATKVPRAELEVHHALLRCGDGGASFLSIMRSFETTGAFEARIRDALAAREFPAQVIWGQRDPFLRVDDQGEHARTALGLDTLVRLDAKHFVAEDSPAEIAKLVAELAV